VYCTETQALDRGVRADDTDHACGMGGIPRLDRASTP
jgi:hypothetical protein